MNIEERIRDFFIREGFRVLLVSTVLNKLLWQPDLLVSKDGYTYPILVKSNNNVLPTFLNRIAEVPSNKVIPIIIFSQKATTLVEKNIFSLGISIGYYDKGEIKDLRIIRRVSKQVVRKKIIKRKLSVIDIFVSSKQDIPEREFVADRLETIRKINSYPFNPPHLIEYDKFNPKEIYQHIDRVMENCEWIVIVLEEYPSEYVEYEINKAIEEFEHDNIFMFVKSTKACHDTWKKEIGMIETL